MKKVLLLVAICATTAVFTASAQDVKKDKTEEVKQEQVEEQTEEVKDEVTEGQKEETVVEGTKTEEVVIEE